MPAGHDGDVEEVWRSNETPPCPLEPNKMLLSAPAVLDVADDPHIRRSIQHSLHGTWFEVGGAKDAALGKTGTRVGMPLADLLFKLNFWPVQHEITQALASKGWLRRAPPIGDHNRLLSHERENPPVAQGLSYVDDLVTFVAIDIRDQWPQ
eukprot:8203848-Pyramimonas_sp.AAC.1